jgi:hypothetical protein
MDTYFQGKKNTLSIYVETVNLFLSEGWHWLYLKNWLPFSMSSKDSTTLTEQDLLINQKKKVYLTRNASKSSFYCLRSSSGMLKIFTSNKNYDVNHVYLSSNYHGYLERMEQASRCRKSYGTSLTKPDNKITIQELFCWILVVDDNPPFQI